MIDSSYDAITLFDNDTLIECNATTPKIFRVPDSQSILGASIYSLAPENQADGSSSRIFFNKAFTAAKQGIPQDLECILNRFDGNRLSRTYPHITYPPRMPENPGNPTRKTAKGSRVYKDGL